MRCHYTTEGSQRFFIPGCMGGAVNGPHDCCCYPEPEPKMASKEATQRIKELQKDVMRLERLVWNLTRHKAFK